MAPATLEAPVQAPLLVADVARVCDVSPASVRLWERNGLIRATRTPGGVRTFTPAEVERVRLARERQRARQ